MRVLVACERSHTVRDAFLAKGHDAYSCDLEHSLPRDPHYKTRHLVGDVRPLLRECWDMVIAHPPCTYLCNSGVRHLHEQSGRWDKMVEACEFFKLCLATDADKVCVENPIPHKYARQRIGKYSQIICPWWFGDPETKRTCLWLRGLPLLQSTRIITGRVSSVHRMPPSPNRSLLRSMTSACIAEAMAEQWGK